MSSLDQMFDYFVLLTSNELKKAFDLEEADTILSSFATRFRELYETLKESFNETQLFHGINPIFVIALEESLPGEEGKKDTTIILRLVLAIYKIMLEELVLEPQRRYMASSKDPWTIFVEAARKGNQRIYDNEYFQVKEINVTEKEFAFDINRCFYHEVFKQFKREDLGFIMCEYDSIMADNITNWVRFEREETIAEGYKRCTFRYYNIKQKFSENLVIDSIFTFLKIVDDSEEMLTKQEIREKGFDASIDFYDVVKLIDLIKNHPGIKFSTVNEEPVYGNIASYQRHEEWKKLFNRKLSKEERSKIIQNLPLNLKEEKINRLISDILDHPYEHASIKWVCLNYLQYHFSARIGFEAEEIDELQLDTGLLEEFRQKYPNISFEAQSLDRGKISIQAYGRGIPEYKLKEPIQLLRKKIINQFPDSGISAINPIISMDPIVKKFFKIFEDSNQDFQLRELALRILISRVGSKLVPFLKSVAENEQDNQFLRGRAIDSLAWFTSKLPQLYNTFNDFIRLPDPIKRSVIDFIARQGTEKDLLLQMAINDDIAIKIKIIALRNMQTYLDPEVTKFLLNFAIDKSNDERMRQAALEALGKHSIDEKSLDLLFNIFKDQEESTFIRMEAFETLRDLNYKPKEVSILTDRSDWIILLGLKQMVEG
ncbi:L-2-amino-thiazoline-4-carboxylic acid hydrolase [Candidatus Hodarchaeum mangrovi]